MVKEDTNEQDKYAVNDQYQGGHIIGYKYAHLLNT